MRSSQILAVLATTIPSSLAVTYKGFNYGSTFSDGTAKTQSDYEGEFTSARNLQYTDHTFTSARLFTTVQAGTTNSPIAAIPAAIATNTSLLLGLWASAGQAAFNNELAALRSAITQYGSSLTDLVAGISVGSEDIYRTTPLGVASNAGTGATVADLTNYIAQVRALIANTPAATLPVGHVDTYNVYTDPAYAAIFASLDFVGADAYPYYETTKANGIANANATFWDDYTKTVAAAGGKPVWVTETGWPISGPASGQAVASVDNAARYYAEVGCHAFSHGVNTWWFILQDQQPVAPAVVFGVAGKGTPPPTTPIYSLAC